MTRAPAAPVAPIMPGGGGGSLEQRLAQLADALARKADATLEPAFTAVLLRAPGGASWRVTVDDAGVLHAVVVAR